MSLFLTLSKEVFLLRLSQNTSQDYLRALAGFTATLVVLKLIDYLLVHNLKNLIGQTRTKVDDFLLQSFTRMGDPFYFLLAINVGLQFIVSPGWLRQGVYYAVLVGFAYYITKALQNILEYLVKKSALEKNRDVDSSLIEILIKIIKAVLWITVFLLILSNLGYNITSLLTGLGVGGIAVGFALQNILEDLFSAFSIYFDKPFKTGDTIVFGGKRGTVKKIGIKSTRVKTLKGDELIVPNKDLTSSVVHNFRKMKKRRAVFTLGVGCNTSVDQLRKIPGIIERVIEGVEIADFDRAFFTEFGDFTFNFQVVYYINAPSFRTYRKTQHEINIGILEEFSKENIDIPYPTQKVILKNSSQEG